MADSKQPSNGLRILWWSDTYWPHIGGIEVLASHIVPRLIERGFEVVVLTSQRGDASLADEIHDGVPIRRFPMEEALKGNRSDLWAVVMRGINSLKSEFRPDIVHLNVPSPSCLFHLMSNKAWKAPTVAAIHTALPPQAHAAESLTRRMLDASAWVIANSKATLRDVSAVVPEVAQRSSVIYNGLPELQREPSALQFDPPVIACIARLVEKKSVDIALRAFAIVRRRIPRARMIVAGDGPERERLHALAAELEVIDAVDFIGWVEPAGVADVIGRATLVVVSSRQTESFGMVALEAMQMGRPVVVTDTGGLPEVVADGGTGFVVPADNAAAIAHAAIRILEDPLLAGTLGTAGRARAGDQFGIERCVDEHASLYRRIAGTSPVK